MEKSYEVAYHNLEETHWWFCGRRDMIIRLVSSAPEESRILEIGCSGGLLLSQLHDTGYHNTFGIDTSEEAVRLSRKRGLENIKVADGRQTGFEENLFDIIVVSDVLEHIREDLKALEEWRRILKPNGLLIVFVPAHMFLWSGHDTLNHHVKRYGKREFLNLVRQSGFVLKKSGYWNFLLFFPILLLRFLQDIIPVKFRESQLYKMNWISNVVFFNIVRIENYAIAHGLRFPAGVSLFCSARKKDYRLSHHGVEKSARYERQVYRAGSYDDIMWENEKKILVRELEELKERVHTIDYLDFACGTGRILSFIEPAVSRAVGVDISSSMLGRARQKVERSDLIEADLTVHDVLEGRVFDCITAFRFFLNAEDALRDAALASLVPKLKNEKSVYIFNMHGNFFSYRLLTKIWYWFQGRRLNTSTYWESRRLARRHGLYIVRWYGLGFIPKIFYRYGNTSFLQSVDRLVGRIPLMKYVAYDLIFVCKKI